MEFYDFMNYLKNNNMDYKVEFNGITGEEMISITVYIGSLLWDKYSLIPAKFEGDEKGAFEYYIKRQIAFDAIKNTRS